MTEREKLDIFETKVRLSIRSRGRCEVCGKPMSIDRIQLAHRIPKTKYNLKTYGKKVIHHDLNLVAVCSLKCNSEVLLNIASHPKESEKLIEKIKESL